MGRLVTSGPATWPVRAAIPSSAGSGWYGGHTGDRVDVDDQVGRGGRPQADLTVGIGLDDQSIRRRRGDATVVVDVGTGGREGRLSGQIIAAVGGDVPRG